ncbi:DUF4440 domain-containing protein [Dyella terrae]|uniref:DUF4440 domain-containing protein n=3 Tax=Rhodanobacteraceae TaxID=1775411 RepID=A0A4R0YUE5_9GAMM|nr:DUF4440 domain-containing protein [Dyella terrae]TCI08737.1 DUF4440 domain-containing protein [Dyella soli]
MDELIAREPIFHRPEFGTARADFERMTDPSFFEIGASGHVYSRSHVLDVLEQRHRSPVVEDLDASDFHVVRLANDVYLLTYTLHQAERMTRRTTLWKRGDGTWRALFHQGTVVAPGA